MKHRVLRSRENAVICKKALRHEHSHCPGRLSPNISVENHTLPFPLHYGFLALLALLALVCSRNLSLYHMLRLRNM
jgi:hypothetical protein